MGNPVQDDSAISPNLLLRGQMQRQGVSKNALARRTGLDERTIQRWLGEPSEDRDDDKAHKRAT